MTRDLRAMADYLQALGVTHVALESTGVLWKSVGNILDGRFTLLLVNPRHVKQVPGHGRIQIREHSLAVVMQSGPTWSSKPGPPGSRQHSQRLTVRTVLTH